jgi:hypothetical protein
MRLTHKNSPLNQPRCPAPRAVPSQTPTSANRFTISSSCAAASMGKGEDLYEVGIVSAGRCQRRVGGQHRLHTAPLRALLAAPLLSSAAADAGRGQDSQPGEPSQPATQPTRGFVRCLPPRHAARTRFRRSTVAPSARTPPPQADIKKAYLRGALQWHPDRNPAPVRVCRMQQHE